MPEYNNSNLVAMDMNQTEPTLSFGKDTGFYFSRKKALFLFLLFISGLVATGLLVFYYAPREGGVQSAQRGTQVVYEQDHHDHRGHGHKHGHVDPEQEVEKVETTTAKMVPALPSVTTITTEEAIKKLDYNADDEKLVDIRLPRTLKPLHYTVKLQPFINGNFSINGYVDIEFEVLDSTYTIVLHILDIITHNDTVKVIHVDDPNRAELAIKKQEYDPKKAFYTATLEKPLAEGKIYSISMHFQGYLNDKLKGFYRSSYRDSEGNERWLAATFFQTNWAREAFPCFDEPGLKATFEIYLGREQNMTAISNMPLAETLPLDDEEGWVWDRFSRSVPMSTYLVAFVIFEFPRVNTTANDTLFRVWAREAAIDQSEYSFDIGLPILRRFEDYFNISYPLPKLDMIALPDFGPGAMENWGVILYRESTMLYDPAISAPKNKYTVALVVAHELAHQWFGNLVTPEWWNDLWLNKGFALFFQYIGMDYVEPTWKVNELFVTEMLQSVLNEDSLQSSHQISISVGHSDESRQIFDAISYNKGASLIRMMNHFLTEDSLRKGLTYYLEAFQYSNAKQDDLWHYLTKSAHEDETLPADMTVKEIMDTWTLQMGYPVITVSRSTDGSSATLTQERFLMSTSNSTNKEDRGHDIHRSDNANYMWWVPINYASQSIPDFNDTGAMIWMKAADSHITLDDLPSNDEWVVFNIQETGYYRVNYDENNWNLLIQQLRDNHTVIHTVNRAQIIDDAMNLAKAGLLDYGLALRVYSYLANETEYVPWQAAFNNLDYLLSMFQRTGGYGAMKNYILDLIIPLYESVGLESAPEDDLLDHYKRNTAILWACRLEYEDCLNNAISLFSRWMENPDYTSIIAPNLKSTVYCKGIELGGEDEWQFAWESYLESNVASEKRLLLSALGCTKKIWMLSRYMEMAFSNSSGIRKQDSDTVFSAVGNNDLGRPLAWSYLRDKWDDIYVYHGKARKKNIKAATEGFNTKQQLREITLFEEDHRAELEAVSKTVEQVQENTLNNIAWMEKNYNTIVQYLEEEGYSPTLNNS
ncbi:hypothetical protein SK128_026273 [Halocaridina rubra]|uniref:Aminopeptidase N n=1 Tax=Halocaridina rubra TaxID=373956 RepID=A0AAN8WIK3_HALRR